MTEREKLQQAKRWIDCLAQGIHPLTGEELPEQEAVNDVRISRCLFFVAEVLRRELDAAPKSKAAGKKPFVLTWTEREEVELSEKPIPASELARRLNRAAHTPGIRKIQYAHIVNWLTEVGFLRQDFRSDGRLARRPTAEGEKLGITVELRRQPDRTYPVVVYGIEAQRFVLDNVDAVAAYAVQKG